MVFIFPGPRPFAWPPVLAPSPGPQFVYTDLVPPVCIYWPWPTVCITGPGPEFSFTFLLVVILAVVVISLE